MNITINITEPAKKVQEFQEYDLGKITTTLQELLNNSSIIVDSNIIPILKVLSIDDTIKKYIIKNLSETLYNISDYITGQDLIEEDLLLISGNDQNTGVVIDTAFIEKTYAPTMSIAYNSAQPNFEIDIIGNLDLTITGTVNGDSGLVNLYFSATEVATLQGFTDLIITGASAIIPVYFIHDGDGLKWYQDGTGGTPIDTSLFALADGTILYHTAVATSVGTFSNVANACTGIGTTITPEMVGAKITKANGEVGIITARASDTSFTVTGFTTNSVSTAFNVKSISIIVNADGSMEVRDKIGKTIDFYYADGNNRNIYSNFTTYRRLGTWGGVYMDYDITVSPKIVLTSSTTYTNDAAADADGTLSSGSLYWITGDRIPRKKP